MTREIAIKIKSSRNRVSQRCPGFIQTMCIISKWIPASAGMTCFDFFTGPFLRNAGI